MYCGAKRNSETNKLNGFYFRWKVEIFSMKGSVVSCIAEEAYTLIHSISDLTPEDMFGAMKLSFIKFKKDFDSRIDILGYEYFDLDFPVSLAEAGSFLDELTVA